MVQVERIDGDAFGTHGPDRLLVSGIPEGAEFHAGQIHVSARVQFVERRVRGCLDAVMGDSRFPHSPGLASQEVPDRRVLVVLAQQDHTIIADHGIPVDRDPVGHDTVDGARWARGRGLAAVGGLSGPVGLIVLGRSGVGMRR
ncbi:hypothetical protein [Nocardia rhamnosiphila]